MANNGSAIVFKRKLIILFANFITLLKSQSIPLQGTKESGPSGRTTFVPIVAGPAGGKV